MSLEVKIMDQMKEAMKAKDSVALEALRAIKSAIILAKTEAGATDTLTEDQAFQLLRKNAMSHRMTIGEMARRLLDAQQLLNNQLKDE